MDLTVFCDACALYPAPVRDLLLELSINELFYLKWSKRVLDEWVENLLLNRPDLSRERLQITVENMNKAILDGLVENFHALEKTLSLPDEGDNHVLAAAIKSKSNLIVTYNLKDFPKKYLATYGVEAIHPDLFFIKLFKMNQAVFVNASLSCHLKLKNPPKTLNQYLDNLKDKCGLLKTYDYLKNHFNDF